MVLLCQTGSGEPQGPACLWHHTFPFVSVVFGGSSWAQSHSPGSLSALPGSSPSALTSAPLLQAQKVSDDLMQKISSQNRRALDLVVAKCYYYHSRIYEFLNKLDVVRR